jgi:hypothetical protein
MFRVLLRTKEYDYELRSTTTNEVKQYFHQLPQPLLGLFGESIRDDGYHIIFVDSRNHYLGCWGSRFETMDVWRR